MRIAAARLTEVGRTDERQRGGVVAGAVVPEALGVERPVRPRELGELDAPLLAAGADAAQELARHVRVDARHRPRHAAPAVETVRLKRDAGRAP